MSEQDYIGGPRCPNCGQTTRLCQCTRSELRAALREAHARGYREGQESKRRLEGALEVLVHDEVISAGRARELHGMTTEEQRAYWRDLCTRLVPIWLSISPKGEAVVSIEWEGQWVPVIRELHIGGVTSHIVEPNGIRSAIARALPTEEPER